MKHKTGKNSNGKFANFISMIKKSSSATTATIIDFISIKKFTYSGTTFYKISSICLFVCLFDQTVCFLGRLNSLFCPTEIYLHEPTAREDTVAEGCLKCCFLEGKIVLSPLHAVFSEIELINC